MKKISTSKKLILALSSLLVGVSVLSVGFAAFIITVTSSKKGDGNVHIGNINDSTVHFNNIVFDNSDIDDTENYNPYYNQIRFDADDDGKGRVYANADSKENLVVSISGLVGPYSYIDKLTYQLVVPSGVKDALDAGYISLLNDVDCVSSPKNLTRGEPNAEGMSAFQVNIGFKWGAYFNYENPARYYDDSTAISGNDNASCFNYGVDNGAAISDKNVEDEMKEFRKTMYYGKDYEGEIDDDTLPTLEFTVNFVAVSKGAGE